MLGIVNYQAFVLVSVLLAVTPGSDTIYILSKSASGGKKVGVFSALGITSGIFLHTLLAAFGLSAILAASATAFRIVTLCGVAYLVYMGIRTIMKKEALFVTGSQKSSMALSFRQGLMTNALNPKVALFFLAFLPQYVSTASAYGPVPFLLLGLTYAAASTVWCFCLAYFSSFLANVLNKNEFASRVTNKVTGCIYIGLGLNILRAKLPSKSLV